MKKLLSIIVAVIVNFTTFAQPSEKTLDAVVKCETYALEVYKLKTGYSKVEFIDVKILDCPSMYLWDVYYPNYKRYRDDLYKMVKYGSIDELKKVMEDCEYKLMTMAIHMAAQALYINTNTEKLSVTQGDLFTALDMKLPPTLVIFVDNENGRDAIHIRMCDIDKVLPPNIIWHNMTLVKDVFDDIIKIDELIKKRLN